MAYARSGDKAQARKMLDDLMQRAKQRHVTPFWVAMIYMRLGDKPEALRWLEKAYEERSTWLTWIKMDPATSRRREWTKFENRKTKIGLESFDPMAVRRRATRVDLAGTED